MVPTELPVVVALTSAEELSRAAALYRRVFGYDDPSHAVNPRLLRSLAANGGSVVGAHSESGDLIAFAYGFVGTDENSVYHYSQAAVVDAAHQGRGLGRALKLAQREIALGHGQTHMRWSYDPVLARNGHFNLDVLGAVGRWFHRDFFGLPGTDRVIVDWDLETAPGEARAYTELVPPARLGAPTAWLDPLDTPDGTWLAFPADLPADAAIRSELRAGLGAALGRLVDDGMVAVSCRRLSADAAAYLFTGEDRR